MEDEYYLGQIIAIAGSSVPSGFLVCNGHFLPISNYQALFSLIGNRFGGDGVTTFALPDLRGRTPVGAGVSADQSWQPGAYPIGASGGAETVVLSANHLPAHTHDLQVADSVTGNIRNASGSVLGVSDAEPVYRSGTATMLTLADNALASRGDDTGHENMQPFQVIQYCMVVQGIYPSRT